MNRSLEAVTERGAVLTDVQLQGAYDDEETVDKSLSFEKRIAEQVGRASNLTTVTFSGGIKQEHYHTMLKELHECARQKWLTYNSVAELLQRIAPHVGQPADHTLPSKAKTEKLTQKMASQIIADYRAAMETGNETMVQSCV